MTTTLMFIGGGILLVAGAELLVKGASRLASAAGISPIVIGLTVVAFGTSAPELAVTIGAASAGQADVALGNVVGSNIFNILFILGISAIIAPLTVSHRLVRLDVPIMIAASLVALGMAMDGRVSRVDGLILVTGIIAYTGFLIVQSRRAGRATPSVAEPSSAEPSSAQPDAQSSAGSSWISNLLFVGVGLALLVIGAGWFVDAAVALARILGASELVIGLTIVAAGTSLPEVATSVLASIRGERDIAVGNVVGSNIFNLLAVLGIGSVVAPDGIPAAMGALTFDMPVMVGVAVAALPVFFTGYAIARWEGFVFLAFYAAYTSFLILQASSHHALDELSAAMLYFVLPLTAITLLVLVLKSSRTSRAGPGSG